MVPGIEGIGDLGDAVVRERNRVVERRISGCSVIAHTFNRTCISCTSPHKRNRSRTRPRHHPPATAGASHDFSTVDANVELIGPNYLEGRTTNSGE
jgi:hypothetical protein